MNDRFIYDKEYRDIEKDVLGEDINTREELQALADEEGIRIDWDRWDKLVQRVREMLTNTFGDLTERKSNTRVKEIWAYDLDRGKLIGHYDSSEECGQALDICVGTVRHSASTEKPVWRLGMHFSYHPLTKEELASKRPKKTVVRSLKKRHNPYIKKPKWVYDLKTHRLLGQYDCTADAAEAIGMTKNQVNYQASIERPYYRLNLIILNHPMNEGKETPNND